LSVPFHRTPQGLSNQAAFIKVDAVVFAEGGSGGLTIEAIEQGGGDTSTLDCAFWSTVLRHASGRTIEVRSVGNKPTLAAIAELVAAGKARKTVVAMDRDFDQQRGADIQHPNVLYTFGYSWENDVFQEPVLLDVVSDLAPNRPALEKAQALLRTAAKEIDRSFTGIVRLDYALATQGEQVTLREEVYKSIGVHHEEAPKVDRSVVAAELSRCRIQYPSTRLSAKHCARADRDLYGHALAKWWLCRSCSRSHGPPWRSRSA